MPPMVARLAVEHIDRKPKPVRFELAVQLVEHDARLDDRAAVFRIEMEDAVEVLRHIEDDAGIHRLPRLGRAPAASGYAYALIAAGHHGVACGIHCGRDGHGQRHDLIGRCIGRITFRPARPVIISQPAMRRSRRSKEGIARAMVYARDYSFERLAIIKYCIPATNAEDKRTLPGGGTAMVTNSRRAAGRHFLQIPGPTPVPDRIQQAMARAAIDHRGPEFQKLGRRVLDGMKTVFKTAGPVVIYPSSGTGAWEAALTNTLSPATRC